MSVGIALYVEFEGKFDSAKVKKIVDKHFKIIEPNMEKMFWLDYVGPEGKRDIPKENYYDKKEQYLCEDYWMFRITKKALVVEHHRITAPLDVYNKKFSKLVKDLRTNFKIKYAARFIEEEGSKPREF
jgi:CHAT domain-containing protein